MPTDKPRFTVTIDEELMKRLEDYRFENRFSSRSKAVVELVRLGLDADYKKKRAKELRKRRTHDKKKNPEL